MPTLTLSLLALEALALGFLTLCMLLDPAKRRIGVYVLIAQIVLVAPALYGVAELIQDSVAPDGNNAVFRLWLQRAILVEALGWSIGALAPVIAWRYARSA